LENFDSYCHLLDIFKEMEFSPLGNEIPDTGAKVPRAAREGGPPWSHRLPQAGDQPSQPQHIQSSQIIWV